MSWAEEAFGPVRERYRRQVQRETWGHLAPKKNKKYPGEMVFCLTEYGDYALIRTAWAGLEDSPWLFDAMTNFITENASGRDGKVLKFTGFFRNYRFEGAIEEIA